MYLLKTNTEHSTNKDLKINRNDLPVVTLPILKIIQPSSIVLRKERGTLYINKEAYFIKDMPLKSVIDILTAYNIQATIVNRTSYLQLSSDLLLDFSNVSSATIPLFKSPLDISLLKTDNKNIKQLQKISTYHTFTNNEEVINKVENNLLYTDIGVDSKLIIKEVAIEYFILLNLSTAANYNTGCLNNSKINNLSLITSYYYNTWSGI